MSGRIRFHTPEPDVWSWGSVAAISAFLSATLATQGVHPPTVNTDTVATAAPSTAGAADTLSYTALAAASLA